MNEEPTNRLFALSANTGLMTLLLEAERLTTAEEALEITTANLKEDDTFCDDFKEDLLWLISVKDQPIEIRKTEWDKRVEAYRVKHGYQTAENEQTDDHIDWSEVVDIGDDLDALNAIIRAGQERAEKNTKKG